MRLTDWIDDPNQSTGLTIAEPSGHTSWTSYADLSKAVRRAAQELSEAGVRRGDVVSLVVGDAKSFLTAFFAVLYSGGVVSPAATPMPLQDRKVYLERLAVVLGAVRPVLVICDDRLREGVRSTLDSCGLGIPAIKLRLDAVEMNAAKKPHELAYVQFSSGSSGRQKGIPITHESCLAQVDLVGRWLQLSKDDVCATWLPLYHDMGLICCVMAVVQGSELKVLKPEQFVARPLRWLEFLGRDGATLSAAPNFGLAHVLRRVNRTDLEGLDFTSWRGLITGAERIDPQTVKEFINLLEPFGFSQASVLPAYGLAEATLAVSGRRNAKLNSVTPAWSQLEIGSPVKIENERSIDSDEVRSGAGWVVSCGSILDGYQAVLRDEDGDILDAKSLGELCVRGASVASGYYRSNSVGSSRFVGGELRTGDAAFFHNDELYIVGRIGDGIKVRGRYLFAEEIEARVAEIVGVAKRKVAVVLGDKGSGRAAIAIVEEQLDDSMIALANQELRREIEGEASTVFSAPGGTIPRTSSGKVRRAKLWEIWSSGKLLAPISSERTIDLGA